MRHGALHAYRCVHCTMNMHSCVYCSLRRCLQHAAVLGCSDMYCCHVWGLCGGSWVALYTYFGESRETALQAVWHTALGLCTAHTCYRTMRRTNVASISF